MFKDRKAKIMVIEQSGPVRQLLISVLRSQGYEGESHSVGTVKDAVGILEVERIDWIITALYGKDEINALSLLSLICARQVLKDTRVTLLIDEDEEDLLPTAYEKGMLSHIAKPYNKESLTDSFNQFHEKFEAYSWSETKISASYLRAYLLSSLNFSALLDLEKSLLKLFPGDTECLIQMAMPQCRLGQKEEAKRTLKQVITLDPERKDQVEKISQELFSKTLDDLLKGVGDEAAFNALGITSTVVIDSDDSARKLILEALGNLGVEHIFDFDNGEDAWKHLSSCDDVGLVLQEWKIPKLTGPLLIQRIRKRFPVTPVILVSSLLNNEDLPLVREMGVVALVKKPLSQIDLSTTIISVIQQDRMPTRAQVMEDKIRKLLEAKQYKEAFQLKVKYLENQEIPEAKKNAIEAEFAYYEGQFERARNLALSSIRGQSDSIVLLNFLGKCLMQLRDFVAALKCFQKAQSMSPQNVERLCAIAEANSEIGDEKASMEAINEAKSMDQDNEEIKEKDAEIKISEGKTAKAKKILDQLDSLSNVISYMNNKAVASARSGLYEEGVELYQKTIASIPEKNKIAITTVSYNLALAFVRMNNLERASAQLDEVIRLGKTPVFMKSKSIKSRIDRALTSGTDFKLVELSKKKQNTNDFQSAKSTDSSASDGHSKLISEEHASIMATMEIDPGGMCCLKVFLNPDPACELAETLLEKEIHFTPREAVAREEAAGLERILKGS